MTVCSVHSAGKRVMITALFDHCSGTWMQRMMAYTSNDHATWLNGRKISAYLQVCCFHVSDYFLFEKEWAHSEVAWSHRVFPLYFRISDSSRSICAPNRSHSFKKKFRLRTQKTPIDTLQHKATILLSRRQGQRNDKKSDQVHMWYAHLLLHRLLRSLLLYSCRTFKQLHVYKMPNQGIRSCQQEAQHIVTTGEDPCPFPTLFLVLPEVKAMVQAVATISVFLPGSPAWTDFRQINSPRANDDFEHIHLSISALQEVLSVGMYTSDSMRF